MSVDPIPKNKRLALFLLAGALAYCLPLILADSLYCAQSGEPYSLSGSGGQRLNVKLSPSRPQSLGVPKTLDDLAMAVGEQFICLKRENFLIACDLDPGPAEYLVDGVFDFCRRALINAYFDRLPSPQKTINLYLFRNYSSYVTGLRRFFNMDPISPYGHYGHSQKYLVINYETGPGTMVHEMTHALMADDFPEAPIWLAEGMASLYEQCRAEGNVLRGEDNWRLPELKAALGHGNLTPLARLLAMTPATFRSEKESLNYAQARYFCKYLEELGVLTVVYKDFRDRCQLDPTGSRFISKALGKSIETIDNAWRRWVSFQNWHEGP